MSRQRKQKLSVREPDDVEIMEVTRQDPDPTMAPEVFPTTPERNHDPFLHQGFVDSPLGLPVDISAGLCSEVMSPLDVSAEDLVDGRISTFMDALPDDPWDLASLEISPTARLGDRLGKEIFQDLRYTSTPKGPPLSLSATFHDSGLHSSRGSQSSRKRIRFSEEPSDSGKVCSVLHDITGNNSLMRKGGDSFVNITACTFDSDTSYADCGSENLSERDRGGKRVSIIRRNVGKKSGRTEPESEAENLFVREFPGPPGRYSEAERTKVAYYSGVEHWETAASLLTRFHLPGERCLSPERAVLLTLMRLRLNLEWRDLAFRFDLGEEAAVGLFRRTLETVAASLAEEVPWSEGHPRAPNRQSGFLYVHPVTFMGDSVRKILVFVSGGRTPVLYVSKGYPGLSDAVKAVAPEVGRRLVPGDVLCRAEDRGHACFGVQVSGNSLRLKALEAARYAAEIDRATQVLDRLKKFKMFSGKFTAKEEDMRNIVTVIAGLVNLDASKAAPRFEESAQLRL